MKWFKLERAGSIKEVEKWQREGYEPFAVTKGEEGTEVIWFRKEVEYEVRHKSGKPNMGTSRRNNKTAKNKDSG